MKMTFALAFLFSPVLFCFSKTVSVSMSVTFPLQFLLSNAFFFFFFGKKNEKQEYESSHFYSPLYFVFSCVDLSFLENS